MIMSHGVMIMSHGVIIMSLGVMIMSVTWCNRGFFVLGG